MHFLFTLVSYIKTQQNRVLQWNVSLPNYLWFLEKLKGLIHPYYFLSKTLLLLKSLSLQALYAWINSIRNHCQTILCSWPPHNHSRQQGSGNKAQTHLTPYNKNLNLQQAWASSGCMCLLLTKELLHSAMQVLPDSYPECSTVCLCSYQQFGRSYVESLSWQLDSLFYGNGFGNTPVPQRASEEHNQ